MNQLSKMDAPTRHILTCSIGIYGEKALVSFSQKYQLKRKLTLKVHSKKDFGNSGALYGSL